MDKHAVEPAVELEEWVTPELIELQAEDARSGSFAGGDAAYSS